ncbi:hypothetical protein WJX84_001323 [Apatococcus fuscideae]|uniref:Uncharacterized protein n=1 Tax=Apatococcus fuscideae TaxID=2026836 RepID=A0AAW1T8B6_9CHLO
MCKPCHMKLPFTRSCCSSPQCTHAASRRRRSCKLLWQSAALSIAEMGPTHEKTASSNVKIYNQLLGLW